MWFFYRGHFYIRVLCVHRCGCLIVYLYIQARLLHSFLTCPLYLMAGCRCRWSGGGARSLKSWYSKHNVCCPFQVHYGNQAFQNCHIYRNQFLSKSLPICTCMKHNPAMPFPFLNNSFYVSKLGVPIKTSISPYLLEEAMNGTVTVRPLPLGKLVNDRVSCFKTLICC
jgi:hypothetical protein